MGSWHAWHVGFGGNNGERKAGVSAMEEKLAPVRGTFDDLQNLIGCLGEKLTGVTANLEQEFLSAYRVHQISIQEELKDLKELVSKAEESLVEDGAVARMEEECNWFKSESKRLQSHVSSMTKDMNLMTTRLRELRDQKAYLSDQLKAILKRSRVFSAEIDYVKTMTVDSEGSRSIVQSQSTPAIAATPPRSTIRPKKKSKTAKKLQAAQSANQLLDLQHKLRHTRQVHDKYNERLEEIAESRSNADVRLEDAIHSQFDKVVARKTSSILRGLRNRQDLKDYAADGGTPGVVPPAFAHDIPKINGLTGLGVEYLTEKDKFQAVVGFLSDAEIFKDVVETLQSM